MARWIAASAATATCAGMIAFPLARRGGDARRSISNVVVGGLATTTSASAVRRWGAGRAALAASLVATGAAAVERVGTATGWPFGRYCYTGRLRPEVAGVPAAVPAAWWAMAVPAREAAHAVLGGRSSRPARIALGATALAAWDLFLDPQMTAEDYWRWTRRGSYRGIPLSNYAGWLLSGTVIMAVLDVVLPPSDADAVLVAEYAGVAVMEAVGFAAFFGDRLVAAIGAAGMLPLAASAVARLVSRARPRASERRGSAHG
jgi:putative membrane protein